MGNEVTGSIRKDKMASETTAIDQERVRLARMNTAGVGSVFIAGSLGR
jgi:hypothetical protein